MTPKSLWLMFHSTVHKSSTAQSRAHQPEPFAMRNLERKEAMRFMLHGGVWLDKNSKQLRCMGGALRGLRDHRDGREHEPHPLLLCFTSYTDAFRSAVETESPVFPLRGAGVWQPSSYKYHAWS